MSKVFFHPLFIMCLFNHSGLSIRYKMEMYAIHIFTLVVVLNILKQFVFVYLCIGFNVTNLKMQSDTECNLYYTTIFIPEIRKYCHTTTV